MKRINLALLLGSSLILLSGCMAPKTFVRTMEPTWASVEIRSDESYDKAWAAVVDTLVKRFDMEVLSKEDGYARTSWLYTWTGKVNESYRVRVTVKFNPERTKCEIKSEAEFGGAGNWVMGYDSRLLSTIKTDVMGNIGRTTR
ncbi:hypothetical protein [Pontiella sulfatireligans]|uniref:DUF3576 domain-containing protein n=1 Tax=Pontiella sulfatireligans TaxID=2750658 RepID=A0A6C2UK82_9BACT|nr:hypothetical protein [Pontiella sulfatireligans]VGO20642.1 hypothetical protein SCARR_02707 [Pontiella sulfatireligans]